MEEKQSLLQILQKKGAFVSAPCGGNGKCKKCAVRFLKGATEPTLKDREIFSDEQLADGMRLACLSYPVGEYEVEIPEKEEKMEILTGFENEKTTNEDKNSNLSHSESYGVAIDIGTTTLAAVLLNLTTGKLCKTASFVNHQRIYGADVISRIQASNNGKKWEMQKCIRQDLKGLILELVKMQNIQLQQIKEIVMAGNTTMCHLLCGYSCEALGIYPFKPVNTDFIKEKAGILLGFKDMTADVTILPGISAFVGADIVSGIAFCHLMKDTKYRLLLDIGTNGEMVLCNNEKVYVTSAAAGPALEGGNISCGMASIPGAIAHVNMERNGTLDVKVIGNAEAFGICGSGMIDLLYELRKSKAVDEHGTLCDTFFDTGYQVTEKVKFCQNDIRELQMAKAAIRAGIDILIKKAGISLQDIETCYLAGGFGTQIDIKKASGIGLLPEKLKEKTISAGNTSLSGATEYLKKKICQTELTNILKSVIDINLAGENEFETLYLEYLEINEN